MALGIHQITILQRVLSPVMETRNVWYCGSLGTSQTEAESVAQFLWDTYDANFASVLPGAWSAYGATVRDVTNPGWPEIPVSGLPPIIGSAPGDLTGCQLAGVFTMYAAATSPRRVRKFIGPMAESQIAFGRPAGTFLLAMENFCEAVRTWNLTQPAELRIVAARWDKVANRVDAANAVTGWRISGELGALRSRKAGVGI